MIDMSTRGYRRLATLALSLTGLLALLALVNARSNSQSVQHPPYPDNAQTQARKRGAEAADKLTPELRILFDQYTPSRGGGADPAFNPEQLQSLFGIKDPDNANPVVNIGVQAESTAATSAALRRNGAKVYFHAGDTILASAPVRSLERIAADKAVLSISAAKSALVPPFPRQTQAPDVSQLSVTRKRGGAVSRPDNEFDAQGLTGKGVIIGIIDTGIDWRHEDFRNADGSSRILYLWDMTDDSFARSGGRIGVQPPVLEEGGDPGPGTIYTKEQIDAALQGRGRVNSTDNFGHGTASAGTAAGNGRAAGNGVPPGTYKGVAPEADLIIVKAGDCEGFDGSYLLGTVWIAELAKARHQPVVINHSLGAHVTPHDGNDPEERVMNALTGPGKPGTIITVSAGNEGLYSMHARGRFGPRVEGQGDIEGSPIEVVVSSQRTKDFTWLNAYFDKRDDWGLVLRGSGDFMVDQTGAPLNVYIFKIGSELRVGLPRDVRKPANFDDFAEAILDKSRAARPTEQFDRLWVPLPPGSYYLWGFGPSTKVSQGTVDLYLPFYSEASFTIGADKENMVGSPGNAANVITVASYDFRADWDSQGGMHTAYNLPLSAISDYSSPGGLRADGVFKPDITAPARYTISSLSENAAPGSPACRGGTMGSEAGPNAVTRDGRHIAWAGTSAAAPYTAGVIALMLQKNPTLDAKQVREILIKTAIKGDRYVGAVPNVEWGYGKIDPAAAIRATPAPGGRPTRPRPRRSRQ
jgi:minor extracellular serine protease Vpr